MPEKSAGMNRLPPAFTILIAVAAGLAGAQILGVTRLYEPSEFSAGREPPAWRERWPPTRPRPVPTHADNDRSRWATIRALVDHRTYVIGRRQGNADFGIVAEEGWRTIDKVLHPDTEEFYSSKPPLLATLMAAEYWVLRELGGWTITENPWIIVRVILLTWNWVPFVVYLFLLGELISYFGSSEWGQLYVLAAACFATSMTTFISTLNNHTVATWSVLFALYPLLHIWYANQVRAGLFIAAGFFSAFAAA